MNLPWPLDDCPDVFVDLPSLGHAGYVSPDHSEAAPMLWVPDPDAPSTYVEHAVRPKRRPIGFPP